MTVTMDGPGGATQACGGDDPAEGLVARAIERGVTRLLRAHDYASVGELSLPDGRRADVVALSSTGHIVIVEIKSCLADFRSDEKWPTYRDWCDALYFAVDASFPSVLIPEDVGLIVADRYGGVFERAAPERPVAPQRRKSMSLRFARTAALRLQNLRDPDGSTHLTS